MGVTGKQDARVLDVILMKTGQQLLDDQNEPERKCSMQLSPAAPPPPLLQGAEAVGISSLYRIPPLLLLASAAQKHLYCSTVLHVAWMGGPEGYYGGDTGAVDMQERIYY